MTNESLFTR